VGRLGDSPEGNNTANDISNGRGGDGGILTALRIPRHSHMSGCCLVLA